MEDFRALPAERRVAWLMGSVAVGVLVFLVGPVVAVLGERQPTINELIQFGGLAGFVALYLWAVPSDIAGRSGSRPARAAFVLALIAIAIVVAQPTVDWTVLFIATGTATGRIRPARSAVTATALTAAVATVMLLGTDAPVIDAIESGFEVLLAGILVLSFSELDRMVAELRVARSGAERAAASEERLRIARDMHDLLGHSLSVIALKAELARRLVDRAPAQAVLELRDVESVARDSLRDVREAVAGFRRVTLDTELAGARMALGAAGVTVDIRTPDAILDEATDGLLGWIVREGTTNVVRHSGARRCSIDIAIADNRATLEIVDDGHGTHAAAGSPGAPEGNGLRGIRERVDAAGGRLDAGPAAGRGFRLWASIPLAGARAPTGLAPAPAHAAPVASDTGGPT